MIKTINNKGTKKIRQPLFFSLKLLFERDFFVDFGFIDSSSSSISRASCSDARSSSFPP